ncbi:unnamed protein product [Anisakis simplex]|uniref:Myelin basic protein n=1 Tax=Anisakis simplex TaxID=6269 RepID=A0A0M3JW07_ANISI|nr:unnamed protein product [Anisakis simplex]
MTPLKIPHMNWADKLKKMSKRVSFVQSAAESPVSNLPHRKSALKLQKKSHSFEQNFAQTHSSFPNLHCELSEANKTIMEDEAIHSSTQEAAAQDHPGAPLATPERIFGFNGDEDVSRRRSRLSKQRRHTDETVLNIERDDLLL